MKEENYDELLGVRTCELQMGFHRSFHYHRYEPTPYQALDELFRHYRLNGSDRVVDFGCGKGRLNFFIHHLFQSTVVGIEMNEEFYEEAVANRESYLKKVKASDNLYFYHCLAEEYTIHPKDNRFYFFNPFSVQIFMRIINNILFSVEQSPRDIEIVLYYSSDDYVHYLENHPLFVLRKEVNLSGDYEKNEYERFLVYGLMY
ncbi:methyltransferase [Rossellomorea aquimaris]|uniref:Methyltransferase family protein n=1 Tax=Rossellomorea aquimaris TaxID=189382 RepID=A0A366EP05_9BACI|nr:methyltransferase [Rossellomorea aquimaris]RBP03410.1 methyltransferase family protein [Rossellomorea aquimaris]